MQAIIGESERLFERQPGLARTRATLNHELPVIPERVQQVILVNRVSQDDPVGL